MPPPPPLPPSPQVQRPPVSIVAQLAPCDAAHTATLHVDKNGAGGASRTIGSALTEGQRRGLCDLTVQVGPGQYDESIEVRIPHLRLLGGNVHPVLHGAVQSTGHSLELDSIDVAHASGIAVRQIGGRLRLGNVTIRDTEVNADVVDSGIAVWVSGGAQAVIRASVFDRNAQGIHAEGDLTKLWVFAAAINGATGSPAMQKRMLAAHGTGDFDAGALAVLNGASAWVTAVAVQDSALAAIHAGRGAKVRLDATTVRRVSAVGTGAASIGGFGVLARDGAIVEWVNSSVSEAALCGIAPQDASISASGGFVARSPVGACVTGTPRQDVECMHRGGLQFRDVVTSLTASSYGLPTMGGSAPVCASVPAEPEPIIR